MQTIYLDISNKGVYPCIHAKQGEVGRKFLAVITDNGLPYAVPEDALLSVWYSGNRDEGNYSTIGEKSAFSIDGNKVTVELVAQMLLNPGEGEICLSVSHTNGAETSTWNIPFEVESKPGAGSSVPTEYYTAFSEIASSVAKSASDAEEYARISMENASLPTRPFSLNRVVCIGDSFLDGNSGNNDGWGLHLENMAKSINQEAVFWRESREGGAGFLTAGTSGNTLVDLLRQQAESMTQDQRNLVESVIVVGGINDVLANTAIDYSAFVILAKEMFERATIVVAMTPACVGLDSQYFQNVLKPSNDPDVCVLTDSYYWIISDEAAQGNDLTHPSEYGYKQIATHLFYASKGMNLISGNSKNATYTGDFGSVAVSYSKSGNSISFKVVGTMNEGFSGPVNIGAFMPWVNQYKEPVLSVWSNVPGVGLDFLESNMHIFMPEHVGTAIVNGVVTANIDMF